MAKSSKNIQQYNEQDKTFNLGAIETQKIISNKELNYEDYLKLFENFIKSHKRVYYCLNQVRENNNVKILTDKTITVQCQYLTNLFKEVNKLPILSTKQNLLDSIKNNCLVQNDKFVLEKTYNILYSKVYNLKSDFSPVTQNSLRIINLSNNSKVEIEHVKYYNFIIDYIDDTLNGIDKIFTLKELNKSIPKTNEPKKHFDHKLNDTQLGKLLILINSIKIFKVNLEIENLKQILECSINEPLQSNNNQHLSHLFNQLYTNNLICEDWQNIIEINDLFIGKKGAKITSNNLSVSLNKVNFTQTIIKKITTAINELN